jgi:hypothetical protein
VNTRRAPSAIQIHQRSAEIPNSVFRVPETMIPTWTARNTAPTSRANSNAQATRNPSSGWRLLLT